MVPQTALGSSQLGKYVYVIGKDNKVDQRLVSLGPSDGELIAIEKGVFAGDRVISGNLQKNRSWLVGAAFAAARSKLDARNWVTYCERPDRLLMRSPLRKPAHLLMHCLATGSEERDEDKYSDNRILCV
jgi:hypothetical protein